MSDAPHTPMATLRFFADDLKPAVVTEILRLKPNAAARKGQPFDKKGGAHRAEARVGTWFVTTEGRDIGNRPEDHLAWVITLAIQNLEKLRRRNPDVKVDFSLVVFGKHFDIHDVPRDLLKIAVLLGELELEIPERGIDMFLNKRNLSAKLRKARIDELAGE
jgi:hypothetical protein